MTFRELRDYLNQIGDDGTLDCHVSLCFDGEFYQCDITEAVEDCPTTGGILDDGHPYLEAIL